MEARKERQNSVVWLLVILVAGVFVAEALVMVVLPMLPPMSELTATLLDAASLSLLLFPIFYFLVFRPLTQTIADLGAAKEGLQLAASVFSHAREGIMITKTDGTITEVNDTFCRITGFSRNEVIGQNPRILQSGRHPPEHYETMWRALLNDGYWDGEIWNRRKDGEVYAERITISAVRDGNGTTRHFVALFSDITQLMEHQKQLETIAHHDALTHLPNRVVLADRLHQAIAHSQRRKQSLAVAYLDLDGFKAINDTKGHEFGDEVLIAVSQRMNAALREGDTLARVGGDEFVAVLVDLAQPNDFEPVLARVLEAAAHPVMVGDTALHVTVSIGVTLYPQDNVGPDALLSHADQAMYQAKQAGKNRYQVFDGTQNIKQGLL